MPTIEQLEALLNREPDDAFLNFGLAMQLSKEQRHEESLARFDHVIRLDPGYTAAYHQKGIALVGLHRIEDAREVLKTGVEAARRVGNAHAEAEMSELLSSIA
jgi:tetratricopeptide (TPR) repeat protein